MVSLSFWRAPRTGLRQLLSAPLDRFLVPTLARLHIPPNFITLASLLGTGGSAYLVSQGHLLGGGLLFLLFSALDMVDGALARATGHVSRRGAFLDSAFDRVAEGALLLGLLFLYRDSFTYAVLIFLALFTSLLVSYLRARAEGLGLPSPTGLFTRPERVLVLSLGLLLDQVRPALSIVVILSAVTALHRGIVVWQATRSD